MQRILLCDADARTVRALRVVLRDAGFRVQATASAEDALDAAALRPPAVAIVELALPDADGVDLCRQLREWSAIPVIVLSAIDEEHHKVRALNAGADDYRTKPAACGDSRTGPVADTRCGSSSRVMRGSIVIDPRTSSSGRVRRGRPPGAPVGRTAGRDAVWHADSASGAR
jgi:CheY-like chemotaxis protein